MLWLISKLSRATVSIFILAVVPESRLRLTDSTTNPYYERVFTSQEDFPHCKQLSIIRLEVVQSLTSLGFISQN